MNSERPVPRQMTPLSPPAQLAYRIRSYVDVAKSVVARVDDINETRKRILIFDDDPELCALVIICLADTAIHRTIATVPSGHHAFEIAERMMPDLIITGWRPSKFNSLDLLRKLKQNPLTCDIPVIVVTDTPVTPSQRRELLAAGVVDHLEKPINETDLKARVKTALVLDESLSVDLVRAAPVPRSINHGLAVADPGVIFYLDDSGNILGCNGSFEDFFGVTRNEILFRSYEDILPHALAESLEARFTELSFSGMSCEFKLDLSGRSRQHQQLLISLTKFGEPSRTLYICTLTDIPNLMTHEPDNEIKLTASSIRKLQADLEAKHRELATHTQLLIHTRIAKEEMLEGVNKLEPYLNVEGRTKLLSLMKQLRRQLNDEALLVVEKRFDAIHAGLYSILEEHCPDITRNEKRLCAYLRMDQTAAEIAKITNKSLNSINVGFARLRAKMNLSDNKALRVYLNKLDTAWLSGGMANH